MAERKQEIINTCLETFVNEGLIDISMRDLGQKLGMDAAGIYYYFKGRDELVVSCAEEAAVRIETDLIGTALQDVEQPDKLARDLHDRAIEMRPLMNFFISVCTSTRYRESMLPALERLSVRYQHYTVDFAEKLCCKPEEIAPYVYIVINTMLSYMIFGQSSFAAPQLGMAYDALNGFLEKRNNRNL